VGNQTLGDLAVSTLKGIVIFNLIFLALSGVFRALTETTIVMALAIGFIAMLLALIALVESTIDGAEGIPKGPDKWVQKFGYSLALTSVQVTLMVATIFARQDRSFAVGLTIATSVAVLIVLFSAYRTWPRSRPEPHEGL